MFLISYLIIIKFRYYSENYRFAKSFQILNDLQKSDLKIVSYRSWDWSEVIYIHFIKKKNVKSKRKNNNFAIFLLKFWILKIFSFYLEFVNFKSFISKISYLLSSMYVWILKYLLNSEGLYTV